ELGGVAVDDESVVQVAIRGQADQGGGWRERRRQAYARAVLQRAIPGGRRCPNVVKVGRVVESESRLRHDHFVEAQGCPNLAIDVAREQQLRPAIDEQAQLASCRRNIVAAKRT